MGRKLTCSCTAILILLFASPSYPANFIVKNTLDAGVGSFRQAILDANASAGPDTISFAIAGAGPHTIAPTTALPVLIYTTLIDGFTQSGSSANTNPVTLGVNAVLKVELTGTLATVGGALGAIHLQGGNSVVRGLVINNWTIPGVYIDTVGGNVVEGCFIGTDVAGTVSRPNAIGVHIHSAGNTIGGLTAAARNLISGNTREGIRIDDDDTSVYGNFIGIDASGTTALSNYDAGVRISSGGANSIGGPSLESRNIISGNRSGVVGGGDGVWIETGSGNSVTANFIGLDVSGLVAVGNQRHGVYIESAINGWVGGTIAGRSNVISGNEGCGVVIDVGSYGYTIAGNLIGTDVTGASAVANDSTGVVITGAAHTNAVGGTSTAHRNVISGNGVNGISILSASSITVQNNYIGSDIDGALPVPNGEVGVFINASSNTIGTPGAGLSIANGNTIAFNMADGVVVESLNANTIRGNSIHSNGELGIDLRNDGVTANDVGDPDGGANNLLNYPVITKAVVGFQHTRIAGTFNSFPGGTFAIDFYTNAVCDGTNFGEGYSYLGSKVVYTDGAGDASFDECLDILVPFGEYITATATDLTGNTSEFSQCAQVLYGFVVFNTNASGPGSLADAIANGAACPGYDGIVFNIPGPGPHLIAPSSSLAIGARDVVDGYSQVGSSQNSNPPTQGTNAVIAVELDLTSSQIVMAGGNSAIRGLALGLCPTAAVFMQSDSNIVYGCFVGTDASGTAVRTNDTGIRSEVTGENVIGSASNGARNLISGNTQYGVYLHSNANKVRGNQFGTNAAGTAVLVGGTAIAIEDADNNQIGGAAIAERNTISGGIPDGVHILGTSSGNTVLGNYIGTNTTGYSAQGNLIGVKVSAGANGNSIGGTATGERNVISGNNLGIYMLGTTTTGNVVEGNFIGLNLYGQPLGNAQEGIYLFETSGNTIGGQAPRAGNAIFYNGQAGVVVDPGGAAAVNRILGNSMWNNGGLGIDWNDDGVTANGLPDAFQDFPVLSFALQSPGATSVTGSVTGPPWTEIIVEFFDNADCDPSGYGEGVNLIGDTLVTTDGFGNASLNSSFPLQTCGAFVTATATKRVAGETSEFSACIPVVNTPAGAVVVVEPHQGGSCLAPVTVTFDNVTGAGFTSYTNSDSCPDVTGAFIQADSVDCYVIETTASFTKTIQFCVEYNVSDLLVSESDLLLLHYDSVLGDWTDVTTSIDSLNNMIYGEAEELGAFRMGAANPLSGVAGGAALPTRPALYQNVPNPFNPVTSVPYDVPIGGAYVSIRVYDVAGRFVRTLVDAHESAGRKHVIWDGRNHSGQHLATGVYFCRFRTGDFVQTRKLLLLK